MMRVLASLAALALLSACGLQPIYAGGSNGVVARGLAGLPPAVYLGAALVLGLGAGWMVPTPELDRMARPRITYAPP